MKYICCKLCNDVMESSAYWRIASDMHDHIKKEHPDIAKKVEESEEKYQEEIRKIEEPDHLSKYLIYETFPKKAGRKEFEGKIIKYENTFS